MKKLLAVIIVAAAIIAIVYYYLSPGSGDFGVVADNFFQALNQENYDEAHKYMADIFKESTTDLDLRGFFEDNNLKNYRRIAWEEPKVSEQLAELTGVLETAVGQEIYIKVTFIETDGQWKIMNFQRTQKGYVPPKDNKQLPPEEEMIELVSSSMLSLAEAIKNDDFTNFYDNISILWKKQISQEKIKENFQPFIDKKVDLTYLKDMEPMFTEIPEINDKGGLVIEGYYSTEPLLTEFKFTYVLERGVWKLAGTSLHIR